LETSKKYQNCKIVVGHGIGLRPEGGMYMRRFFLKRPVQTFGQWLKMHQQLLLDNWSKNMLKK
jgi:hypothetical protein